MPFLIPVPKQFLFILIANCFVFVADMPPLEFSAVAQFGSDADPLKNVSAHTAYNELIRLA